MDMKSLKVVWSAFFDQIGEYDRRLRKAAHHRVWFMPLYHRILNDDEADPFDFGLGVRKRHFDQHLAFYRKHFHVCTVSEGLQIYDSGDWPDKPLLSVTFDDGYLDNIDLALPLLEQHDCKASFFICTGPISDRHPFWWDVVIASATKRHEDHWQSLRTAFDIQAEDKADIELRNILGRLWDLSYDQIQPLVDLNRARQANLDKLCPALMDRHHVKHLVTCGMEVAAHTHHHPNLTKETDLVIEEEIIQSKQLLEDWTGGPVQGFATPHGFVDERVKAICSKQNITYIASTDRGSNQPLVPYHLARFGVADAALPTLKRSLTGSIDL